MTPEERAILQRAWDAIDAQIVRGELPYHRSERRNGLVLAANTVLGLMHSEPLAPTAEAHAG